MRKKPKKPSKSYYRSIISQKICEFQLKIELIQAKKEKLEKILSLIDRDIFDEHIIQAIEEADNDADWHKIERKLEKSKNIKPPLLSNIPTPKQLLKPEYSNITLENAVDKVLKQHNHALDSSQVVYLLFDTQTDRDLKSCRNSINQILRNGVEKYLWRKVGRGLYESFKLEKNSQC